METIKVKISRLYGRSDLYPAMPERMFAALEAAFKNGELFAEVYVADLVACFKAE